MPSGYQCTNFCNTYQNDGICDDGGPGSEYSDCTWGNDCSDCGVREIGINSCTNTCSHETFSFWEWQWGSVVGDGHCDDGGPGSEYAHCNYGTDCKDCGARQYTRCELVEETITTSLYAWQILTTEIVRCGETIISEQDHFDYGYNHDYDWGWNWNLFRRMQETHTTGLPPPRPTNRVEVSIILAENALADTVSIRNITALLNNASALTERLNQVAASKDLPFGLMNAAINPATISTTLSVKTTVKDPSDELAPNGTTVAVPQALIAGSVQQAAVNVLGVAPEKIVASVDYLPPFPPSVPPISPPPPKPELFPGATALEDNSGLSVASLTLLVVGGIAGLLLAGTCIVVSSNRHMGKINAVFGKLPNVRAPESATLSGAARARAEINAEQFTPIDKPSLPVV